MVCEAEQEREVEGEKNRWQQKQVILVFAFTHMALGGPRDSQTREWK